MKVRTVAVVAAAVFLLALSLGSTGVVSGADAKVTVDAPDVVYESDTVHLVVEDGEFDVTRYSLDVVYDPEVLNVTVEDVDSFAVSSFGSDLGDRRMKALTSSTSRDVTTSRDPRLAALNLTVLRSTSTDIELELHSLQAGVEEPNVTVSGSSFETSVQPARTDIQVVEVDHPRHPVAPGEPFVVDVLVRNNGELDGTRELVVYHDGSPVSENSVFVSSGVSRWTSIEIQAPGAGTHTFAVMEEEFEVEVADPVDWGEEEERRGGGGDGDPERWSPEIPGGWPLVLVSFFTALSTVFWLYYRGTLTP